MGVHVLFDLADGPDEHGYGNATDGRVDWPGFRAHLCDVVGYDGGYDDPFSYADDLDLCKHQS